MGCLRKGCVKKAVQPDVFHAAAGEDEGFAPPSAIRSANRESLSRSEVRKTGMK